MNKPTLLSLAIFAGFVGSNTAYATALNVQDQTADITFSAATSIAVKITPVATAFPSGLHTDTEAFATVDASTADGSNMWMAAQFTDNASQGMLSDLGLTYVLKGKTNPANTFKVLMASTSGKNPELIGAGENAWEPYDNTAPHPAAQWILGMGRTTPQTIHPDTYNIGVRVASYML